jgi:predicted GH43/DUF377 family glycosyl hydrolase
MLSLSALRWVRDPRNPIFPPNPENAYDATCCMNPCVVRVGDELRLYYAGGDREGHRRICLATAPVEAPTRFTQHGVIVDLGAPGSFNAHWCVLPNVIQINGKWHLYFSGHEGTKHGLQSFPGIGLAISDDGCHFEIYSDAPVVTGDQTAEYPRNRGIAGGSVIAVGSIYRMYYTLAVGTPDADVRVDQRKYCAVCHSTDGLRWTDHRIVMSPRPEAPSEDIAVATPVVRQHGGDFHMLYSGIGTRWGAYSIAEATSRDGYDWQRPDGGVGVVLAPGEAGSWESGMVEYPSLLPEGDRFRLYYCGNGYGATGIGTAIGMGS